MLILAADVKEVGEVDVEGCGRLRAHDG